MLEDTRPLRLSFEPLDDYVVVEPTDEVLFPRDAGYDVRLAGTAQKVLRRGELIARIHD